MPDKKHRIVLLSLLILAVLLAVQFGSKSDRDLQARFQIQGEEYLEHVLSDQVVEPGEYALSQQILTKMRKECHNSFKDSQLLLEHCYEEVKLRMDTLKRYKE